MQYVFLTFFALFWSAIVLMFDGLTARNMFKQLESRHYAVTAGRVTHSEVKRNRGSKGGISYEAVVNYRFELGGRSFFGERLRYNKISSSSGAGSAAADSIVGARPAGALVQVFYNPENPQESLLFPGLDGSDFMMVLFLTPFNAVMFGLWTWIGTWLGRRLFRPVAGGVKIISDARFTRVRLPQYGAIVWGLITTGALSFVSVFVVGFSTQMQPSFPLILSTLGVVYLAGIGVYLRQWLKIHSGIDDLVINHSTRTLDLPQTYGRKQRMTANITNIVSLTVETLVHYSNKGATSYTYAPTLHLAGPNPGEQKLADWSDKSRADDFADWLRKQLGR